MKKHILALFCSALFLLLPACAQTEKTPTSLPEKAPQSSASSEESTVTKTTTLTPATETSVTVTPTETPTETPTSETPTITPSTPTVLSEEEQRDLEDKAFLAKISFPNYLPGEEGEVFFSGRWFEKEIEGETHHVTVTDGAQIFFMTRDCKTLKLDFTVITEREMPYFAVSIDEGTPKRQLITEKTVVLPDEGRHTVRIIADGMTENEAKWTDEIGFALKCVTPGEGGSLRALIPQNKLVFFYGDSITEGIASLAAQYNSNGNSATGSYTWFSAQNLGVIPYFIGYGATGVNCTGSFSTLINAINKLSRTRSVDFSVKPDLIVINHGTNDKNAGIADQTYRINLRKAIVQLQLHYPDTPILVMIPFCQYYAETIRELCESLDNVYTVETSDIHMSMTDAYHPAKAGAISAGKDLAVKFSDILGEEFFKTEKQ